LSPSPDRRDAREAAQPLHSPLSRRLSLSPSRSVAGSGASAAGGYRESQLLEQLCALVAGSVLPWLVQPESAFPEPSLDTTLGSPRSESAQGVTEELEVASDGLLTPTLFQDVVVGSMDLLCSGPGSAYSHPFTDSVDVDTDSFTTEVIVCVCLLTLSVTSPPVS
jgi:hypothetical protein